MELFGFVLFVKMHTGNNSFVITAKPFLFLKWIQMAENGLAVISVTDGYIFLKKVHIECEENTNNTSIRNQLNYIYSCPKCLEKKKLKTKKTLKRPSAGDSLSLSYNLKKVKSGMVCVI